MIRDIHIILLSEMITAVTAARNERRTMMRPKKNRHASAYLKKCKESYRPDAPDLRSSLTSGACSANECTGLVPAGGDLTEEEYREYKGLAE